MDLRDGGELLEINYELSEVSQPLLDRLSEGFCPGLHPAGTEEHMLEHPSGSAFGYCPLTGEGYRLDMVEDRPGE